MCLRSHIATYLSNFLFMFTSDFKKGVAIRYNNDTYIVVGYQFVNPGKGWAFTIR